MQMSATCLVIMAGLIQPAAVSTRPSDETGFVPLFDGVDLGGWQQAGSDVQSFEVRDGVLECTGRANYPAWLRSEKVYENFILRFSFKLPHYTESNLLIHAPLHGHAANVGMALKITDEVARGSAVCHCCSILGVAAPVAIASKKYGFWNDVEVYMDWPVLRVTLNGQLVQDIDCEKNDALRYRLRRGYIGFQDLGCRQSYRDIRIRELSSSDSGWQPLFNGKDFSGWEVINEDLWSVVDGTIRGAGATGYLVTKDLFQDFELFTYVRTAPHTNGGVFYRWTSPLPLDERGYEIQIHNNPDRNNPTGSVYAIQRAGVLPSRDGEWFPMQIFVKGSTTLVRVNGVTTAFTDKTDLVRQGAISLQTHSRNGVVEFKDIRIRPIR